VTADQLPDRNGRREMIAESVRRLVREAKDLTLDLGDLTQSVTEEWERHENK